MNETPLPAVLVLMLFLSPKTMHAIYQNSGRRPAYTALFVCFVPPAVAEFLLKVVKPPMLIVDKKATIAPAQGRGGGAQVSSEFSRGPEVHA